MEHLFTSFFRSSVAGSFKEHRMVFQTPGPSFTPGETEEVNKQKDEIVEALNRPLTDTDSVAVRSRAEVFIVRAALNHAPAADAVRARLKVNRDATEAFNTFKTEKEAKRREVSTDINHPTDAAKKTAAMATAKTEITAALAKINEISRKPAADRLHTDNAIIEECRKHIDELQKMPSDEPRKNELKNVSPFSAETGGDAPSRERLGKGYLKAIDGADVKPDGSVEFDKDGVKVKYTFDAALDGGKGKWKIEKVTPAAAASAEIAAATRFDTAVAPFNAGAVKTQAEKHNDIMNDLENGVTGGARLAAVKTAANEGQVRLESAALKKSRDDHENFFSNDARDKWGDVVNRLRTAETSSNTPVVNARKADLRRLGDERKTAILETIKNLSVPATPGNPVPANIAEHLTVLRDQMNNVDERLTRLGAINTATAAPTTGPDATRIDTPATGPLRPRMDGRNIVIDGIVPPTAQVLVTRPGSTTQERMTAVAGVIRIENAPGGTYRFNSGTQNAEITVPASTEAAPVSADVTRFLGSETERNTLRDAMRTNIANLNVDAVRNAVATFQGRLAAVPEGQRVAAVARLNESVRTPASATADGVEIALNGANLEARRIARNPATPPAAPEAKERGARMSEFIKVLIELVRALLQIEQARTAMMGRSIEAQMKFMAQIEAQMKAFPPAGRRTPAQDKEFARMRADLTRVQSELDGYRKERAQAVAKANAVITRAPNHTLVVEADADIRRPVRVCVRGDVRVSGRDVSADLAVVRREVPLIATTSPSAAAPSREVPTTAFYVGSINVDNRATTNATITNSPGARIDATTVARTDVAPTARVTPVVRTDAPPPPPRVTGSGRRNEGSLNG